MYYVCRFTMIVNRQNILQANLLPSSLAKVPIRFSPREARTLQVIFASCWTVAVTLTFSASLKVIARTAFIWCCFTPSLALFQQYSDETVVHFPNFDLQLGPLQMLMVRVDKKNFKYEFLFFDLYDFVEILYLKLNQFSYSSTGGRSERITQFGHGNGPILYDDMKCTSSESLLKFCNPGQPSASCTHSRDAAVVCTMDEHEGEWDSLQLLRIWGHLLVKMLMSTY